MVQEKQRQICLSAGQRTNQTRIDVVTVAYTYDKTGQIKTNFANTTSHDKWGYNYDAAWNMIMRYNVSSGTGFTFNNVNELTTGSPTYDGNGNLTFYNGNTYVYDDENRLTEIRDDTTCTHKTDFSYDGLGRLRIRVEYDGSVDPIYGTCVSGRSKPARSGRIKTSHFEVR